MGNTGLFPVNSRSAYEPLIHYGVYTTISPDLFQESVELQSSSVTPTGSLWQWALADMVNEDLLLVSADRLIITEIGYGAKQTKGKPSFIKLLKSWLEDDEQEQHDTWEYLKEALDQDRLSDRKLFP